MPSSARLQQVCRMVQLLLVFAAVPLSAKNTLIDGFFITSDHVKLHYIEAGRGQAVVLIPGWLMPAQIWEAQIQGLSKDFHVIALDPRSQGQSDMTKAGNDPLRRSMDIQELMEHLQLDSAALVGWSLGAFDCLAYLRQFGADPIDALVLVDSPLAASSGGKSLPRGKFLNLFESDRFNANKDYVWGLFRQKPPKGFSKRMIAAAALVPTDIALAALDNTQPGDGWEPHNSTLRKVPLLYAITPKYSSQAAYLQQMEPSVRVEIFEAAGHALFVDEPVRFNDLIKNFLQQASTAPAGPSHGKPNSFGTAVSSATTSASPIQPRPLSAVTLTPIPEPAVTATPIWMNPTSTFTATAALTFFPTNTFTAGSPSSSTPTPIQTVLEAPSRIPKVLTEASPTPPPSLTTRLSQTWDNLWSGQAKPTAQATIAPKPRSRRAASVESGENPIESHFFTTSDHVKLHFLEAGQGLALVFIPGWLLPAEIWKAQLEGLSEDYHVIALDPRSQGQSDMTPKGDDPVDQAKDIQELLDHLQLTSVVLVGWSHGGFQVLAYLGQYGTDRLYAAVLVDSALGAASSASSTAPRLKFLEQFQKDRAAATRSFVWGLFKKHPPKDFFHQLTDAAARTPTDIALALMNNAFPGETYQPSLPTIRQVPLLYAVNPKYTFQANYLKQVYPGAKVEIFENSGHALFYDEADHFNGLMRDFLRQAALYPAGLPPSRGPASHGAQVHSFLENPK